MVCVRHEARSLTVVTVAPRELCKHYYDRTDDEVKYARGQRFRAILGSFQVPFNHQFSGHIAAGGCLGGSEATAVEVTVSQLFAELGEQKERRAQ